MFGEPKAEAVMKNVEKALMASDLKYQTLEGGSIALRAMGDDLPITMFIAADDDNRTLNIYCYLMFEIPEKAREKLTIEVNTVNNTINNGSFYMVDDEPKICFKIIQSYFDAVPSYKLIQNLIMIAFKTVDVNDGKLKDLIPPDAIKRDVMYS
ncbi:MAG: YbjN domain-containing protein [Candidatus Methanomethylophilaceae archaeon]|nr:YbjN domain-containing protein [Candidatus Methanomethylophilaceae archaeon]